MKNIYNERLLAFAKHLQQFNDYPEQNAFRVAHLVELRDNINITYKVLYPSWVVDELPFCFDCWDYVGKYGKTVWKEEASENTVASIISFFNLTMDEFIRLFDAYAGQLISIPGGGLLAEESTGCDIAQNIRDLVEYRIKNKRS